eukprot:gene4555-6757_t
MALRTLSRIAGLPTQRFTLAASQRTLKTSTISQNLLADKTGKTGAAVLTAGLGAYLVSQEILILHNETVVVASVGAVTYGIMKKAGKDIADMLDDRAKGILDSVSAGRRAQIQAIEKQIEEQKALKQSMEGVPDFFDAVREYEALRRELSFRQEQYNAYQSTIDKLDNMVAIESSVRSREQDEIIRFLSEEIPKAIKGKEQASVDNLDREEEMILNKCISDLQELATRS